MAPIEGPNGHDELWHFQLDNHNPGSDWRQIQRITAENDQVCGPASIIQSDLGEQHNNFEVVVPIMGPNGHAELWHFFNDNSRPGPWAPATPKRVTGAGDVVFGPGSIIQGSRGPDRNNFEVVVPILGSDGKPELWHYSHDNSKPGSEWVQAKRVTGPADSAAGGGVILESDFGDKRNGNFEVVVPLTMPAGNTELWHFWHDADPSTEWTRSNLITASVFGNAGVSFTRSNFHEGDHRNFEVLIEECAHSSIVHYFRHNSNVDNPWLRTGPIPGLGESVPCSIDPTVTMKICQLTGEFDLEGWDFVSLVERSPAGPSLASHAGRLFLACKGEDDRLNLILSINEGGSFQDKMTFNETSDDAPALTSHNGRLFLAWRGSGNANLNVAKVALVGNTAGGFSGSLEDKVTLAETSPMGPALASHAGRLFLAWKGEDDRLNLILSINEGGSFQDKMTFNETSDDAPALTSHNGRLFLAWRGSGNANLNVAKVALVGNTSGGFSGSLEDKVTLADSSLMRPSLASHAGRLFLSWKGSEDMIGLIPRLYIVVSDDNGATFHGRPRVPEATARATALASHRTSEGESLFWAWQGIDSHDARGPLSVARYRAPNRAEIPFGSAHNRTESRSNIRGCDLGSTFMHNGRICLLFGDTWRLDQISEDGKLGNPERRNFDAMAFCPADANPDQGLSLTFNSGPPVIAGGQVDQGAFCVPLAGVSFGGSMFVFFSDQHKHILDMYPGDQMGRSVVARSDNDGNDFVFLREFSGKKFINVSLDMAEGDEIGLPTFAKTLLIWGSGRYRSSDVYLAAMPLEEIASGRFVEYYAGQRAGAPNWATEEDQAAPLFLEACVGELSVRWNRFVARWLILYNGDNPPGIVLRSAERPWGPWSDPVVVFDNRNDGSGKFLHRPFSDGGRRDWQFDFLQDPDNRPNGTGGPLWPLPDCPAHARGRDQHRHLLHHVHLESIPICAHADYPPGRRV